MGKVWIALAAFLGGILLGLAQWYDSHDPFDARKFIGSVIRSFFGGLLFAVTSSENVSWQDILSAVLAGGGVNTTINVVAQAITGNGSFPIPKPSENTPPENTPISPAASP
jgi:hypothetical protein